PPFKALVTFTADGGLLGDKQGDVCDCGVATSGHGAWARTTERQFSFTFLQLGYDFQGNLTGTAKVRASVTLNSSADPLSGEFRLDVSAPDGSLLFFSPGTAQGRRITVEPLP